MAASSRLVSQTSVKVVLSNRGGARGPPVRSSEPGAGGRSLPLPGPAPSDRSDRAFFDGQAPAKICKWLPRGRSRAGVSRVQPVVEAGYRTAEALEGPYGRIQRKSPTWIVPPTWAVPSMCFPYSRLTPAITDARVSRSRSSAFNRWKRMLLRFAISSSSGPLIASGSGIGFPVSSGLFSARSGRSVQGLTELWAGIRGLSD